MVRRGTRLSVEDFAKGFGLTPESVRSRERGLTEPYGVARILLAVIGCRHAAGPRYANRIPLLHLHHWDSPFGVSSRGSI